MKKRILCFILTLGLVLSSAFFSACGTIDITEGDALALKSEAELKSVINSFKSKLNSGYRNYGSDIAQDAAVSENAPTGSAGSDYSSTNTQVDSVDEGDIIKNDGDYIYKLQGSGLNIYRAQNGAVNQVSATSFSDFYPYEMFLYSTTGTDNDIAVVLGGVYSKAQRRNSFVAIEPMCCYYYYSTDTCVKIFDISSKSNPKLLRAVTLSGNYLTSRIYDGKLYYMSNYYFYYNDEDTYIPKISDSKVNGGKTKNMDIADIYYYTSIPSYNYFITGFIDLKNTDTAAKKAYLGVSGEIYFAGENFYAVSYQYTTEKTQTDSLFNYSGTYMYKSMSRIIKFSSADLKQTAITKVDGTIKDRYSLDEYNSNLRIATSVYENSYNYSGSFGRNTVDYDTYKNTVYSNVYVLDKDLKTIGTIENIAEGERIYSVRFDKEIGSLVTFRNIDPYFKLDLSDPKNPFIAGELKEEGVSDYIHPIEGTSLTIGVGRTTKEVSNSWGSFTTFSGLKVALYDISGSDPVALVTDSLSLSGFGNTVSAYTELMYNPKALLYSLNRGLFAFPVEIWSYSSDYRYSNMIQGLAVYEFDAKNKTLQIKGLLSDIPTGADPTDYQKFYESYWSQIRRGVQIGSYIYTVSDKYITSYSLDTLQKLDRLYTGDNAYYNY